MKTYEKAQANRLDIKTESILLHIQETHLNLKDKHCLRVKCWEKYTNQMDLKNKLV